jgi:exonuclease III
LVQEIQNRNTFANTIDELDDYSYYLKNNNTGLSLGIVYKNEFVKLVSSREILVSEMHYFASRPPLLLKVEWSQNNITKHISLINLHYKCCGDNSIEVGNDSDEEYRRFKANELLYNYINNNLMDDNVIVAGDWNDAIQEPKNTNTFQVFLDDSTNYRFTDMNIAKGGEEDWSWQGWGSSYDTIHFDHILINKNLFDEFENNSIVNTIKIEEYFENGSSEYDKNVSDHRPVFFKFVP